MATPEQNAAFLDYFRRLFGGSETAPSPAPAVVATPSPVPPPTPSTAPAPVVAESTSAVTEPAPSPWWGENKPDPVDFFSKLFKDPPPPPPAFDLTTYDWSLGSKNVRDVKGYGRPMYADTWTVDPLYIGLTDTPNALKVYRTGQTEISDDYFLVNPSTGERIGGGYFGGPEYTEEPWGEWFRTNNQDWSGYVSDSGQWAENLPKLGFKGTIFDPESGGYTPEAQTAVDKRGGYTPEAQTAVDKLKKQGYEFLTNPRTHNNYSVAITPLGTYKLNTEGTSFFEEIAPFLGILATPFLGPLAGALGGGLAGTVAANALVSGGIGALSGRDPLKSAMTGGLTAGIGSLVSPIASSIGADVFSSTGSQALADIASGAIKGAAGGLPSALISGDASNLLTGALAGGVGGGTKNVFSDLPESVRAPVTAAVTSGLLGKDPTEAAIRAFAGDLMKSGPTMPGVGTSEDIQEGFFEPGGPGFMPTEYLDDAEVQRELTSLLSRYPATAPSDWFLGENVPSGIPEWDFAAVSAGLPIGNLEQDFYVAQTKEGPRIVDSAGNVGNFVNGEFVVDTGVTPDLSYLRSAVSPAPRPSTKPTPAPAPAATAAKKQDDLGLLMALAGMMTPQQQAKDDYQLAQIGVASPYGIYGA